MADSDTFGDPSLFEEFEKERPPPDKMLLDKFKNEISPLSKGLFPLKHARAADAQPIHFDGITAAGTERSSAGSPTSEIDEDGVYSDEGEESVENGVSMATDEISDRISQIRRDCSKHDSNTSNWVAERSNLMKEIMELRQENLRLKEKVRVVDPTIRFCDGNGPALEVVFLHNDFSRTFRSEIENHVNHLLEQYAQEKGHLPPVPLLASNVPLSAKADQLLSDEAITHINASTVLGCSQFYQEFIIDGLGWPLVDDTPALTDGLAIPRYQAGFKSSLPCDSEDEDDDSCPQPKRERMKKPSCFNCGGDHRLNECKEPRNQQRISQMSRKFQEAKANMPAKQVRYHEDADVSQKYSHLKPGMVSDQLRDAMGLQRNQLAPFVYQMRQLGYPPGWLEEAKVSTSGLSMFGKHGSAVHEDGDDYEDGEVDSQSSGVLTPRATSTPKRRRLFPPKKEETYDTSKIIDYPGFNVPMPKGMLDEHELLGMPPMLPQHEKSVLELQLTKNASDIRKRLHSDDSTGSRRKKLKPNANDTDMSASDMDISSQEEDLEDLERQRLLIQEQLDQDSCPSPLIPPIPPTPPAVERPPLPIGTPPGTPPVSSLSLKSLQTPNNPPPRGNSISMTPGTPVVFEIGAKQDSLPDADKWANGIIQHIPYENLPGATGTFEKLRKTLSSIHGKKEKEKKD